MNDPALSDDGTLLVASTDDNTNMFVWDVATGEVVSTFPRVSEVLASELLERWHPGRSRDVGWDSTIFDARSGRPLEHLRGTRLPRSSARLSPPTELGS